MLLCVTESYCSILQRLSLCVVQIAILAKQKMLLAWVELGTLQSRFQNLTYPRLLHQSDLFVAYIMLDHRLNVKSADREFCAQMWIML